jgi:phage gp16-like protein
VNHIAAIHTLKSLCKMSDPDYRALLRTLTISPVHPQGIDSSKAMSLVQQAFVRAHMDKLVVRMGVAQAKPAFAHNKAAASAKERKVWAMWNALGREGKLDNASPQALQAWVLRQTQVSNLRFCNDAQLDSLINSLKLWAGR